VRTRSGDLQRTAGSLLATHLCQIGYEPAFEGLVRERFEGRCVYLAAEVRDDLSEMTNGYRFDTRKRSFGRGLGRADDAMEPCAARPLGHGQRARHGPDSPVQGQLTHRRMLGEALGRELSHRSEDG
jgi:hypothetical protein